MSWSRSNSNSGRPSTNAEPSSDSPESTDELTASDSDWARDCHNPGGSSGSDTTSINEDNYFPPSQPYHPLISINNNILQNNSEIDVVVTHDNDWIPLLTARDTAMPDDQTLTRRFRERYCVLESNGIYPSDLPYWSMYITMANHQDRKLQVGTPSPFMVHLDSSKNCCMPAPEAFGEMSLQSLNMPSIREESSFNPNQSSLSNETQNWNEIDTPWLPSPDDDSQDRLARYLASPPLHPFQYRGQTSGSNHDTSTLYVPRGQGVVQGPSTSVGNYYAPASYHAPARQAAYGPQHQIAHFGHHSSSSFSGSSSSPQGPPSGTHHGASYKFSPTMHHSTSSMQNPHSEPPITAAEAENYLGRVHNLPSHLPVHLNSLPDPPPGIRPPQTLPCLMQLAIWSSPNKKLSRTEICDAIAERFEYYRDEPTGAWRNTIRHTLSLKNAFKLCDRVPGQSGRGSTWEIDFANMEGNKREQKRDEYKYEPSPSPPLGSSSAAGSVDRRVRTRYSQSSASHSSQSSPAQFYSASDPGSFHGHYVDHSVRLSAYHQQPTFGHSSFQHSEYIPHSQSMPALVVPVPGHVAMPPQFMSPDTTMHMMGPPASSFSFNTGGLNQDQ
ncbi:hypothetical protein VNI00_017603 [Paramarasmius palmivorus]|uniref:Fork-head domain-containing protein n=1 Tax=Paramarasmius palmivorus TaxID=297713 RepID=A0AAW0B548_9AGAR